MSLWGENECTESCVMRQNERINCAGGRGDLLLHLSGRGIGALLPGNSIQSLHADDCSSSLPLENPLIVLLGSLWTLVRIPT